MKVVIFFILFFIGCGGSKYLYWEVNITSQKYNTKKVVLELNLPDYLNSGYIVGIKNKKMLFLDYQTPEIAEEFYGNYLKKKLYDKKVLLYPWDIDYIPKKVFVLNILDYYIDFDKKEAIIKAMCCHKVFDIKSKFKSDYLRAYKNAYDELIKKIGGLL